MRHLSSAGVLGALFTLATMALTGCAGSQPKGADDALTVLNRELSMTLTEEVGTTTVTSAPTSKSVLEEQGPMPLPEDRMSLSGIAPRTWGTPSVPPSLTDISPTRE